MPDAPFYGLIAFLVVMCCLVYGELILSSGNRICLRCGHVFRKWLWIKQCPCCHTSDKIYPGNEPENGEE